MIIVRCKECEQGQSKLTSATLSSGVLSAGLGYIHGSEVLGGKVIIRNGGKQRYRHIRCVAAVPIPGSLFLRKFLTMAFALCRYNIICN